MQPGAKVPAPMSEHTSQLEALLGDSAAWVREAAARTRSRREELAVCLPQLPRKLGRDGLGGTRVQWGTSDVNLAAWRRCDAAASLLFQLCGATDPELAELYAHGDLEERAMVLRSLALRPSGPGTAQLLGEVQRTNMVMHVEAAVCDSNLLARSAGTSGFGATEANRLLLKLAFLDLPLQRVFGAEALANAELSRMLQDLATEREAAGRPVWRDTDRMLGRAPVPGSVARILGGIEHGDDGRRLAAAEGLLQLKRAELTPLAAERLSREPRADVRAVLARIVG
ncbi:MAG: hypothetical protein RL148_1102 [Planctomycetota bacterium]